jgi:hypothetical protein
MGPFCPNLLRAIDGRSAIHPLARIVTACLALLVHPCVLQAQVKPEPVPPALDFQAISEQDTFKRGDSVTVLLLVVNKSKTELKDVKVRLLNPGSFLPTPSLAAKSELSLTPQFANIPAFAAATSQTSLTVDKDAKFIQHKLLFSVDYQWEFQGQQFSSSQTANLSLLVARQFEEEAKGLPGGTAALLYLILPIVPAIMAYEFWDALRKKQGLKIPQFKTEYIVPSFLLALILGFFLLVAAKKDASVAYSSPRIFVIVMFVSALLGSAIPCFRWCLQWAHWRKVAFQPGDTLDKYLIKVLSKYAEDNLPWAKGTVNGEEWEGLVLLQPDGTKVLGASVQVSPETGSDPTFADLKQIVDSNGKIRDREKLISWLRAKSVKVTYRDFIKRGGQGLHTVVASEGLSEFRSSESKSKPVVVSTV